MFSDVRNHIAGRAAETPVESDPFTHICVENAMPADFYAEVLRRLPRDECYRRLNESGRVQGNYSDARYCLMAKHLEEAPLPEEDRNFWREFFATFTDGEFASLWLRLFRDDIVHRLARDFPGEKAPEFRFKFETFLMRDYSSYSLGPHTDAISKVVSVLFYLPGDDSRPELGTSLYRTKVPGVEDKGGPHYPFKFFDKVKTLPYKPNTIVAFPKTRNCFHGVEPVAEGRRDLVLFDIKLKNLPLA